MKVRTYFFGCLLSVLMWQCAPKENEYVVLPVRVLLRIRLG